MHVRILALAVVALSVSGASGNDRRDTEKRSGPELRTGSTESGHWREAQSCGVASACMLARLLGREIDYRDAVAAIPIEGGGSSLLALQQGLQTMGLSAAILKAQPAELDRMAMPVIAHLLPRHETNNSVGHFLLVLHVDDHFVRYIEPSYAASIETVPRNQFLRCWSGYLVAADPPKTLSAQCIDFALWGAIATSIAIALLPVGRSILGFLRGTRKQWAVFVVGASCASQGCVALRPNLGESLRVSERLPETQQMPGLVAWNTEADLGALPRNGSAEGLFRIENLSDAQVHLHLGSPTCRCSQARIDKEILKPGESTNVRMLMRSRPLQAGPVDARVYVAAEGESWAETLTIHGFELGAHFPDYTYVVGGLSSSRTTSVAGSLFAKSSTATAKVDVPLSRAGLDLVLGVRGSFKTVLEE